MASEISERVMGLLQELAVLKEQNRQHKANLSPAEQEAHRLRRQRHEEITQEIKDAAEERKKS